jgi:glycosyltransferase involved in cell wall biosynthesis
MARSERRRRWSIAASEFAFPHHFLRGCSLDTLGHTLHLNPLLLHKLRKLDPEVLLVAGSWTSPSVLLAGLSRHAKQTIFWPESHLDSIAHAGAFANWARRLVLSQFREFAAPGAKARGYVERFATPLRIHPLPNVIDPELFQKPHEGIIADYRRAMRIADDKRVLLISARLAAEKGLLPFLKSLKVLSVEQSEQLSILIAGDGPQREEIVKYLSRDPASEVRLLGFQTQAEMAKLYAIADGFCLPSLSDPNPVAVVEALWSGLPLLLSSRVGNHVEALIEGRNGFLFDPLRPERIADAVSRWLHLSTAQLKSFGELSAEIARREFDPDCVVSRFLDSVFAKG